MLKRKETDTAIGEHAHLKLNYTVFIKHEMTLTSDIFVLSEKWKLQMWTDVGDEGHRRWQDGDELRVRGVEDSGPAANEQEMQEEDHGNSCVNKTGGVRTSLTLGDLLAYKDPS